MKRKQTHCLDCGERLDVFGICPETDPRDAHRMTAPVNCGLIRQEQDPSTSREIEDAGVSKHEDVLEPTQPRSRH